MRRPSPIRRGLSTAGVLLVGFLFLCVAAGAQQPAPAPVSSLPAAQPTGAASQNPVSTAPAAAEHHVEVDYADGMLAVRATNAGLNEILREVGRKTGMKITGGVPDDRVFGNYGPSTPPLVLDALLDGTETNMLLVNDAKGGSELILTSRHGGATPPNPNAARQTNEAEETGGAGYVPPVRPYLPPDRMGRGPGGSRGETPGFSPVNTPGSAPESAPGSASGSDASGVQNKTPQEIYDQLQQTMQQQRHLGSGSAPQQ